VAKKINGWHREVYPPIQSKTGKWLTYFDEKRQAKIEVCKSFLEVQDAATREKICAVQCIKRGPLLTYSAARKKSSHLRRCSCKFSACVRVMLRNICTHYLLVYRRVKGEVPQK
jgi:hypothetical protein